MSEAAQRAPTPARDPGTRRRTPSAPGPLAGPGPGPASIGTLQARAGNRAASLAALGGGVPLPAALREEMEARFGESFREVRVHDEAPAHASAAQLHAKAYTHGEHVVFGAGRFTPHGTRGKGLLAHELAHVLQQRRGGGAAAGGPLHEQEANAAARSVEAGAGPVAVQGASAVGVACAPEGGAQAPAPAPGAAGQPPLQYEYIAPDGRKVVLSADEFEKARQRAIKNVRLDFERIEGLADNGRKTQQDLLGAYHGDVESFGDVLSNPKSLIGIAVDIRAGVTKPYIGMWSAPKTAIKAGREALDKGDLREAARMLSLAGTHYKSAENEWNKYLDAIQQGGDKLIAELELVRDVSFAIAIAAGAAVAAPVVAAGVAGVGLTGTSAVAATTIGTGGVVAVGGAGLRGTTAAAGSYVFEGKVNMKDVKAEASRGAKEGLVAGVTAGLGTGLGNAMGVGAPGASTLTRVGGGAVAGGASGAVGEMSNAALHGKGFEDVAKAGGRGLVTGAIGGAAGGLGGAAKSPLVNKLVTAGVGAGSGALGAHLAGANKDDVIAAAAIGGATSLALAGARPGTGKAEQKAFDAGRKARRTIKTGAAAPTAAAPPTTSAAAPRPGAPAGAKAGSAADAGLSGRGYRPAAGERATGRAAWKAKQGAARWKKSVDEAFARLDALDPADAVEVPRVTGGASDPRIGGKAVPGPARTKLDLHDLPLRPGETPRQAAARIRNVIGTRLSDHPFLEKLWNDAKAGVLARTPLTKDNYGDLYERTRKAFWRKVRGNTPEGAQARQLLGDAGFALPAGKNQKTNAPVLEGVDPALPRPETQVSLDHIQEKGQGGGWQKALDADNLRMEFGMPNTDREIKQMRHPELR